ncbi:MAG: winged helix-turn-helix domain-containing protein [Pyrinomonadaceae bacterium]
MAAHNARTPDWKEQRRWRALGLKRDGWTHQEVAEALDVTKGAVSWWTTRAAREGEEALRARPHLGAAPRLSPEQLRMLPEFLSHGAEAYDFRGELWTCARVAEVIRREFGVSYHKDHVSRLLKALRWTPQKPAERAAQRDEAVIAEWRDETWPELKKKPGASGAPLSSSTSRASTCSPGSSALTRHAESPRCCART